ncbi:unnamed protein product, partial [Urochloa humidicola]
IISSFNSAHRRSQFRAWLCNQSSAYCADELFAGGVLLLSASPTSSPSTPVVAATGHLALIRAHPGLHELVDCTHALLASAVRCPPLYSEKLWQGRASSPRRSCLRNRRRRWRTGSTWPSSTRATAITSAPMVLGECYEPAIDNRVEQIGERGGARGRRGDTKRMVSDSLSFPVSRGGPSRLSRPKEEEATTVTPCHPRPMVCYYIK